MGYVGKFPWLLCWVGRQTPSMMHSWAPDASQEPQRNIPMWGTEAAGDPRPLSQRTNSSPCTLLGLLIAASWREVAL